MGPLSGLRARFEQRLLALWFGPHRLPGWALPLIPPSWLVGRVSTRRRNRIEHRKRARAAADRSGPLVVIVGNLVAGGGGKTPLCLALARSLTRSGLRVGIIARGDGATRPVDPPRLIDATRPDAAEDGDEATLLALRSGVPVCVGHRRSVALARLVSARPELDVVISDDGLQHVALARDLEIVVFDGRGTGNGRLLPAGPLRESVDAVSGFDTLVVNRGWVDSVGALPDPDPAAPVAHPRTYSSRLRLEAIVPLSGWRRTPAGDHPPPDDALMAHLRSTSVGAVAGIARPESFFEMLRGLGLEPHGYRPGDHSAPDARWWAALPEPVILMTEKDAVKCLAEDDERLMVVCVRAVPDPALLEWLEEALRGPTTARYPGLPDLQGSATRRS